MDLAARIAAMASLPAGEGRALDVRILAWLAATTFPDDPLEHYRLWINQWGFVPADYLESEGMRFAGRPEEERDDWEAQVAALVASPDAAPAGGR